MDSSLACYAGGWRFDTCGWQQIVYSDGFFSLSGVGVRKLDPDTLKWCSSEFNNGEPSPQGGSTDPG